MIEDEIKQEINEGKSEFLEDPELSIQPVHWRPVSNLDESKNPYANAPESVRQYHENYIKLWNLRDKGR